MPEIEGFTPVSSIHINAPISQVKTVRFDVIQNKQLLSYTLLHSDGFAGPTWQIGWRASVKNESVLSLKCGHRKFVQLVLAFCPVVR